MLWIQRLYIEFGSWSRVMLKILKEKIKNPFWEKNFLKKKYLYLLTTIRTKCHQLFFLPLLSLCFVNLYLNSYTFLPPFYPIFTCEDPDPESSWIRIRIHNTVMTTLYTSPTMGAGDTLSKLRLHNTDLKSIFFLFTNRVANPVRIQLLGNMENQSRLSKRTKNIFLNMKQIKLISFN